MTTIKAGPAALGRYSVTGFQGGNEPRLSFGTLTLLPTGRYEFVWDAAAEKMPRDRALEFARELAFIREPQGTYTLSYAGGLSGETILNELKDRKTELAHIEFASKDQKLTLLLLCDKQEKRLFLHWTTSRVELVLVQKPWVSSAGAP